MEQLLFEYATFSEPLHFKGSYLLKAVSFLQEPLSTRYYFRGPIYFFTASLIFKAKISLYQLASNSINT